jgi:hypothetical protein
MPPARLTTAILASAELNRTNSFVFYRIVGKVQAMIGRVGAQAALARPQDTGKGSPQISR